MNIMDQQLLLQLLEQIRSGEDIKPEEMPEYRLYISQIEEFFDKKLGKGMADDEERKTISKTMIQNYIKDGLLMPPEGKCYNRSHVILLILIYSMKSILSIKDIKKLLSPILADVDNEDNCSDIEYIYETYLALKNDAFGSFAESLNSHAERIMQQPRPADKSEEEWDKLQMLLLTATLIAQANTCRKIAEHIIEKYF